MLFLRLSYFLEEDSKLVDSECFVEQGLRILESLLGHRHRDTLLPF